MIALTDLPHAALDGGSALAPLLLAAAFSALLGLERESEGKAAGLRTHMLVGLGAALATQLSLRAPGFGALGFADPGRIAAQVVSGIGFIGAGVILRSGGSVRGLTTAATLWVAAMIGMAAGMEAFLHAGLVTAIALVALRGLAGLDRYFEGRAQWHLIEIVWRDRSGSLDDLLGQIDPDRTPPFSLEEAFVRDSHSGLRLRFRARKDRIPALVMELGGLAQVHEVRLI